MSASSKIDWRSTGVTKRQGFQTTWRGTHAARRQASLMLLFIQVSHGGTTLIAKCYMLQFSTGFVAIAWRSNTTVRRYTSTCAVLVFAFLFSFQMFLIGYCERTLWSEIKPQSFYKPTSIKLIFILSLFYFIITSHNNQ